MALAFFSSPKAIASSVAVSQACSAVTTSKRSGMASARVDSATDMFRKCMRVKAQLGRQLLRGLDQGRAGFDAVDVALRLGLEVQVVQDEAQVGLARAMVGQREGLAALPQLLQDRVR